MKKLILVLLMASLIQKSGAQVVIEGRFDLTNPQNQLWDGRYLVYTFYRDVFIYDTQTQLLHKEKGQYLDEMAFKNGLYFRKTSGKYQLHKVGESQPVLPNKFSRVNQWFGNTMLAWEMTEPNPKGMKGIWFDADQRIIASFSISQLYQAVGYQKEGSLDVFSILGRMPWEDFNYFFKDGLITLRNPETRKFSFFDLSLKPAFPGQYLNADPFFEGLAAVQNDNGLWGFIDTSGKEVIPFIYTSKPSPFHSGLARVSNKEGKSGFINRKGELVIPAIYSFASNFHKGIGLVGKTGFPGTFVVLDTLGVEKAFPCFCSPDMGHYFGQNYTNYFPLNTLHDFVESGFLTVRKNGQSAVFDKQGQQILPFEYATFRDLKAGKAIAIQWGTAGSDQNLRFFLMDLEARRPVLELKYTEF